MNSLYLLSDFTCLPHSCSPDYIFKLSPVKLCSLGNSGSHRCQGIFNMNILGDHALIFRPWKTELGCSLPEFMWYIDTSVVLELKNPLPVDDKLTTRIFFTIFKALTDQSSTITDSTLTFRPLCWAGIKCSFSHSLLLYPCLQEFSFLWDMLLALLQFLAALKDNLT